MRVLFAAPDWDAWAPHLRSACPEADFTTAGDPAGFDVILHAPSSGLNDFTPFTRARLVQSLWAGVERIVGNPTLTQPLCRMVDPGLAQGMAEYCTGWVLRAHLGMDRYQQDGQWRSATLPPLAQDRRVTILGMGELGRRLAAMLAGIGFQVTGWSASGRALPGVTALPGPALVQALEGAEILVTLLPDTPDTRNLLDARRLAVLPRGAVLINPGRGTLIDDMALIAALDRGALAHAVLDVFRSEPLPPKHPFWSHPGVTVTPHIAAATRPETAAPVATDNLRRAMAGQPLRFLVDRQRGY
ncbi:MAG: glyoxylate/hydroxypyruvate reductase A [Paracoccus sp. (in: a-proteobacteria)]|uniref:2-hydroxyacid dehydrogenase n=1 Tax=Paracoccus sp. TaxID=267 RepID=UPI0026E072AF|nr:glyoxylate/hydroxypyruvate reductase A [Paracoccus sp. (in: a-proteobacteria)]MDO5622474.1 glyoxylate/hydroxypyruvate reductase A [Paracoccus sp. (in: a-proteobacteria)]